MSQSPAEIVVWLTNDRCGDGGRIPRAASDQTAGGVFQLLAELFALVNALLNQSQTGRAAFLAGVPKRAADHILNCQINIGIDCHDHRVLAAGLGEQGEIGSPRLEIAGSVKTASQNHGRSSRVGHQGLARRAVTNRQKLQNVTGYSRRPELVGQHPRGQHGLA